MGSRDVSYLKRTEIPPPRPAAGLTGLPRRQRQGGGTPATALARAAEAWALPQQPPPSPPPRPVPRWALRPEPGGGALGKGLVTPPAQDVGPSGGHRPPSRSSAVVSVSSALGRMDVATQSKLPQQHAAAQVSVPEPVAGERWRQWEQSFEVSPRARSAQPHGRATGGSRRVKEHQGI